MKNPFSIRMLTIAHEWATELGKFKGHELIVCEESMWGFEEVERGRHPDTVLKEMLVKIRERIDANRPNVPVH